MTPRILLAALVMQAVVTVLSGYSTDTATDTLSTSEEPSTSSATQSATTQPITTPTTTSATPPNPPPADTGEEDEVSVEFPPFDGWYNNLGYPDWGGAETHLYRHIHPAYGDGTYEPSGADRPNPLDLSDGIFSGSTGLPSRGNLTALTIFFGQQVVEEVMDAQRPGCPPEYFNIRIRPYHEQYNTDGSSEREMPFLRARFDQSTGFSPNVPREQLNEISSYLDAGLIYGPNKAWSDAVRSFKGGRLAALNDSDPDALYFPAINDFRLPMANPPPPFDHKLKPIKRFYILGNARGNENPFLLTFGVLWFRYHNLIARQLEATHDKWSDERLFQEARKIVMAVHQKVTVYDWLPVWLDAELPPYKGYKSALHPGISHVFQAAAMRFGHTQVPPGVYRLMKNCTTRDTTSIGGDGGHKALRTCNTYWNSPDVIAETDIDELLMGMSAQIAEKEDNIVTNDLKGDVFGPLEFPRRDLMAINIQRGRDHGIPDYNTVRKLLKLEPHTTFRDINPTAYATNEGKIVIDKLAELHNNSMDDLDLWPAGLLETNGTGPGETFKTIILEQFQRIRDGDRFWYENKENGLYTEEEIAMINQTTLRDIILLVTDLEDQHLPMNIFKFEAGPNYVCKDVMPLPQINGSAPSDTVSQCKQIPPRTKGGPIFDYFWGSEVSYALSFFFLLASFFLVVGLLICQAKMHERQVNKQQELSRQKKTRKNKNKSTFDMDSLIHASEWVGEKKGTRTIMVKLDRSKKLIIVKDGFGPRAKVFRTIDFSLMMQNDEKTVDVALSADGKKNLMSLRVAREYDLVLQFTSSSERDMAVDSIRNFVQDVGLRVREPSHLRQKQLKRNAYTLEDRQLRIERFFKDIATKAFDHQRKSSRFSLHHNEAQEIRGMELTRYEFAESLSLKVDSLFVDSMFRLVDKNNDGYISFKEFLDFFVIFAKGDAESKARLMFDMYDLDETGTLSKEEFKTMLRSMLELGNETIDDASIKSLIDRMFKDKNLSGKSELTFADFKYILKDYEADLGASQLNITNMEASTSASLPKNTGNRSRARQTILTLYGTLDRDIDNQNSRMSRVHPSTTTQGVPPMGKVQEFLHDAQRVFVNYRLQIFWCTLYTLIYIGIFAERAYYYSVEREHAGLRRIAGYGVTVTRGAASAMMFTYSSLLVTMCRNTITFLRETFLHGYIPFDSAIDMHKYIAFLALFSTVMHIIGHMINFYHIATQTANDLNCLFRNYFHATDVLPKFHYWCWDTLTGFTGVLLTINLFFIYVFAIQYARRHAFRAFWYTHNTYVLFFILMIMHGAGRLVQPPFLHFFLLGPAILFTIDRLISVSRNRAEIAVIDAELLPSDVTHLEFKRPSNFNYRSGQWVRIACLVQGDSEYHPFTLTSAPHEENLSLHIRAVGPWTFNLRRTYDPELIGEPTWPSLYLDGPYGEGHQDWYRYPVAILVGGGIGVTPFASILKDIAHRSATDKSINCKKVYFLWVTRTQKQFEWMTDIIREVEDSRLVSVHIFITQFKEKFDIRTTMLYICERHFQKYSERSLFTGLRSITHFGRPDFKNFLDMLKDAHPDVEDYGVFSCGPPPMTATVEEACVDLNKDGSSCNFKHHYENF